MTKIISLDSQLQKSPEIFPLKGAEETLEGVARELLAAFATLRRAELMEEFCQVEAVERAELALAAVGNARGAIEKACEPVTLVELGERIETLIYSIPHGASAVDGEAYGASLVADVGALEPSRGAVEAACRNLRTTSQWLPKIPDVLTAVREAGQTYEAARRALNELPALIVSAKRRHRRRLYESQR